MKNNPNNKNILKRMYETIMKEGGPTGPISKSLVDLYEKEPPIENKKQLSKLVFSSNSKDLDISLIYKGLPKKFIFPQLRVFYFKLAVWFYRIKDKFNI